MAPLTKLVAEHLHAVAEAQVRTANVFLKVGASGTVNRNLLYCFAGEARPEYTLELAGHDELMPGIEHFRAGRIGTTTPFDRATLAAQVGKSAVWAIAGNPSPLAQEITASDARFAFVNYGTNDMGMGATHATALFPFYENLSKLLDQLEGGGIVPIVSGLNPRTDSASAARWVPTYDAVTRGLAEQRRLPYLSLFVATRGLPGSGLLSDGIHGDAYTVGGRSQPCVFDATGLEFSYNVRNLHSMSLLERVRRIVVEGAAAPDPETPGWRGSGTAADPFMIDRLPFTHAGSTARATERSFASYPACSTANEGGPEVVYRLVLDAATPLRFVVLDREGVDIDLHVLGARLDGSACLERDDRIVQRTLPAGTHHVVLDTFVAGGVEQVGEYLFVALPCEPDDPDCD